MNESNDLKFIKDFSKITITGICKDLKVSRANLLSGRSSAKIENLVKQELEKRLLNLLNEKNSKN